LVHGIEHQPQLPVWIVTLFPELHDDVLLIVPRATRDDAEVQFLSPLLSAAQAFFFTLTGLVLAMCLSLRQVFRLPVVQ
jgi:hypothetical protein